MAFADDYIDVPTRIAEFREKYPEGSLRPADPARPYSIENVIGFDKNGNEVRQTFVVVVAAAYRNPDDPIPGIGTAWEIFPGRTPYTRDSEMQNAETSAWGRAIVAALAADTKKGVASQEEVRNRQADREEPDQQPAPQQRPAQQQAHQQLSQADRGWLNAFSGRVSQATTTDEVNDLEEEAKERFKAESLSAAAANRAKNMVDSRRAELRSSSNGVPA